jgi:hypothetical protein
VIWALWGLLAVQFLARRARHAEPYVLSVFILDPFAPNIDPNTGAAIAPPDGKGLNEHSPADPFRRLCAAQRAIRVRDRQPE